MEQPFKSVPVTEYELVLMGETTMDGEESELFQRYVFAPLAVSVSDLPLHKEELPTTVITREGVTVTVTVLLFEHKLVVLVPITT